MYHKKTLQCPSAGHGDLNFHHGRDGNARCATPKGSRRFDSHYLTIIRPQSFYIVYLWGSTLRPHAEGIYKKLKSITEFMWLIYPKATFVTPSVSGELPASRLPRLPWLKIPRQTLTSQNILKHRANHHFLPLIANRNSPLYLLIKKSHTSLYNYTSLSVLPQHRQPFFTTKKRIFS